MKTGRDLVSWDALLDTRRRLQADMVLRLDYGDKPPPCQ